MSDDSNPNEQNEQSESRDEISWVRALRPEVEVAPDLLERTRSQMMAEIGNRTPTVQNPPAGTPQIIPNLPYQDGAAAVDWLERAFGFQEIEEARIESPDGFHAEMTLGRGRIMIGTPGGHGAFPPKGGGSPSQLLSVYVDEIDAHCERARAAGATICAALEDKFYGDRVYEALDLEGHRWSFHMHTGRVFPIGGSPPDVDEAES